MVAARPWLALAALLLATACRTPAPVGVPLDPQEPRWARLVTRYNDEARERRAMRGTVRLKVDAADGAFRVRSRQLVALERPTRLRVEILGLLDQSLGLLVTDGERYAMFRADDRSTTGGDVHPGLLWEQAWLDVTPTEAVGLLLGAPLLDPTLRAVRVLQLGEAGLRLERADDRDVVRERVEFDGQARLRLLELSGPDGGLVWRARFEDYRELADASFAHRIALDVAAGQSRAQLSLRDVELNPELPTRIFSVPEPDGGGAE